jgi:hypothetical protein
MHILLAVGITILAATQVQSQPSLASTEPLSVTFVNSEFNDAISFLSKHAKIMIELDRTITDAIRHQKVGVLRLSSVNLEEAIAELTKAVSVSYEILDTNTIRIFKKA